MGLDDQAATPGRTTTILFDVSDPSVVQGALDGSRTAMQIAGAGLLNPPSNMRLWASGAWTLEPYQEQITNIHEQIDPYLLIVGYTALALASILKPKNNWRKPSDLPGLSYLPSVSDYGDEFIVKSVPANGSWNASLVSAVPAPDAATDAIPLDRVAESSGDPFPPDQGYVLRWTTPGTSRHHPQKIWRFYFGQYAITFRGDGVAELWEYCQPSTGAGTWGSPVWRYRSKFRYSLAAHVSDASHTLTIWPTLGPNGEQIIHFSGGQLDSASYIGSLATGQGPALSPTETFYKATPEVRGTDRDMSPGHATAAGPFRYDIRRDLKLEVQVSKLGFRTGGVLVDMILPIPAYIDPAPPITIQTRSQLSPGGDILVELLDARNGSALTLGPGAEPFVRFTFTGDGHTTPILWGYTWHRDPALLDQAASPTSGGQLQSFNWRGFEGDPSTEGGTFVIQDDKNELARLRNRGELAFTASTTYTPRLGEPLAGVQQNVVIARGYARRPHALRTGRDRNEGACGLGVPQAYPSPQWHMLRIPAVGAWQRLQRRFKATRLRSYEHDPNAPVDPTTSVRPPWKVTDVMYEVLRECGFPDDMIDIGPGKAVDKPNRLWAGHTGMAAEWRIQPATNWSEALVRMARNYFGASLCFAEDRGTRGRWTLVFGTKLGAAPIAAFTTVPPVGKVPHLPQSYPVGTYPVLGTPDAQTIPPDFNAVFVFTTPPVEVIGNLFKIAFCNYAANGLSFKVPGFSIDPDPTHPDYIDGSEVLCTVYDAGLIGRTPDESQRAVDWTVRRLYDFTCHGQRLVTFPAPLALVYDAISGKYRKLRHQDPVTFNGSPYLVRSVSPSYTDGRNQIANYELIQPIAL